jgi:S1-C subfamily serine protease
MQGKARVFAFALVLLLVFRIDSTAQDTLSTIAKQRKSSTTTIALKITRKDQNAMMRALSALIPIDPNAHATGFFVGEGLVMTSYHVVSGKLSPHKKRMLGFKPDDELRVQAYVDGCEAKVVRADKEADLALLKVCSSKPAQRPTFESSPDKDERILLIAQPGDQKMVRLGNFKGSYHFRGSEYWSAKIEGQDGFSGSPVYNSDGEVVGVFCLYDWSQGIALLSPGVKAQQFLADYDASLQTQP